MMEVSKEEVEKECAEKKEVVNQILGIFEEHGFNVHYANWVIEGLTKAVDYQARAAKIIKN